MTRRRGPRLNRGRPAAHPGGRPTKLTPEIQHNIVVMVQAGAYAETAARANRVTRQTFWNWIRRGEREKRGQYREFFDAVDQADALGEIALGAKAARGGRDAFAALEYLGRKYPDRWGRRIAIEPPRTDQRTRLDVQIRVVDPKRPPPQIIDASGEVTPQPEGGS